MIISQVYLYLLTETSFYLTVWTILFEFGMFDLSLKTGPIPSPPLFLPFLSSFSLFLIPYLPAYRAVRTINGVQHNNERNLLKCKWSADGRSVSAGTSNRLVMVIVLVFLLVLVFVWVLVFV